MEFKQSELYPSTPFNISLYVSIFLFIGYLILDFLFQSDFLAGFVVIIFGILILTLPFEIIRLSRNQRKLYNLYNMIFEKSGEEPLESKYYQD